MVEEAAKALVPGPVATTALATLVITDPELLAALASGERFAGLALEGDVEFDTETSRASGTLPLALGAADGGVLLLPADGKWLLVDTGERRRADRAAAGHRLLPAAGPGGADRRRRPPWLRSRSNGSRN